MSEDDTERDDVAICEACGGEIDFTEVTSYGKTPDDRFWHDGCFYTDSDDLVTDGGISRDDLDECWCCDGLHDSPGSLCPECDDAGCTHFGGDCGSDHKPVLPDGGQDVDGSERPVAEPYRFAPDCFDEAEVSDDGSLRLKLTREQAEKMWWVLDKSLATPNGRLSRGGESDV